MNSGRTGGQSFTSLITCHMTISLDGFVAGPSQSREDPVGARPR
jgi:hypothetical protein